MKPADKQYTIYIRSTDRHIPVSKETFDSYYRDINVYRRKRQRNGECACPQNKRLFCDTDCDRCPFRILPETLSLDYGIEDTDGNGISWLENVEDASPLPEEILVGASEMRRLYDRLNELMPEAVEVGRLRMDGLSEDAIGEQIGIGRKTYAYRLKKVKAILENEFPEIF